MSSARWRRPALLLAVSIGLTVGLHGSPTAVAGDPATRAREVCAALDAVVANGTVRCTHGGDTVPAGAATHDHATDHLATAGSVAAVTAVPPAPCPGNGRRGKRLVVLYGYPSDTEPRLKAQKPAIRAAIALADLNLDAVSPEIGGQHYRFFCEDDRRVTVRPVALAPIGGDGAFTFGDLISSLRAADFTDPRDVVVTFVDRIGCCYGPGGQGTMYGDDDPDPAANWNNVGGPHYSMIRLGLDPTFTALAFQHEVGHNLGAVQDSAPHSSLGGHCWDDYDIMCYPDGGAYFETGSIQTLCPELGPNGIEPWDCGQDDYYAVAPPDGSYLDTHWNLANSGWLSWKT